MLEVSIAQSAEVRIKQERVKVQLNGDKVAHAELHHSAHVCITCVILRIFTPIVHTVFTPRRLHYHQE